MFGCYLATAPTFGASSDELWKTTPALSPFHSEIVSASPEGLRLRVNKIFIRPEVVALYGDHHIPQGGVASVEKVVVRNRLHHLYYFEIKEIRVEGIFGERSLPRPIYPVPDEIVYE